MIMGTAIDSTELKRIESNDSSVVNFTIATNRRFTTRDLEKKEESEYTKCIAYGKTAELLAQYLEKWKRIYVEWALRTKKREKEWVVKYSTEVVVDKFIFTDKKY